MPINYLIRHPHFTGEEPETAEVPHVSNLYWILHTISRVSILKHTSDHITPLLETFPWFVIVMKSSIDCKAFPDQPLPTFPIAPLTCPYSVTILKSYAITHTMISQAAMPLHMWFLLPRRPLLASCICCSHSSFETELRYDTSVENPACVPPLTSWHD